MANVGDSRALLIRDGKARNMIKNGGFNEAKWGFDIIEPSKAGSQQSYWCLAGNEGMVHNH